MGKVYDSSNGEVVAGVSVRGNVSLLGTSTDTEGDFLLLVSSADSLLTFTRIGYEPKEIIIDRENLFIEIYLVPDQQVMQAIDIRRKVRYNRRNPAVALIDLVIRHKNENRLAKKDSLYYQQYEKLKMGMVDPSSLLKTKLGKMSFFFRDADSTTLPGSELLTLYMEEIISDNFTRQNPARSKKIITAREKTELNPKYINNENIQTYMHYLFQSIDIYDESLFFINKQFLSPIADNGKMYYKYYLLDTVKTAQAQFARLRFEPFNTADILLRGEMLVSLDGRYAVKGVRMEMGKRMNINWVKDLTVDLSYFANEEGIMLQDTSRIFFLIGQGKKDMLFGERMSVNNHYDLKRDIPGHIWNGAPVEERIQPSLSLSAVRPVTLNDVEERSYANIDSLNNVKSFNTLLSIGYLLAQGYYSLGKFELGPLEYAYHQNNWEGNRFRLGGRTTGQFSEKTYLEGYAAYGTRDRAFKYYGRIAQSLSGKSVFTFPAHYLEGTVQHDVFDPGRNLGFLKGDSFFMGWRSTRPRKWLDTEAYRLGHVLEFGNHLSIATHFTHQRRTPLGDLVFPLSGDPDRSLSAINTNDVQFVLRWAPNEKFFYRNMSRTSTLDKHPIFNIQYNRGLDGFWSSNFSYDALRLSVAKRWFMNQLGVGDMSVTGGKIWGALPYPLLEIPTYQSGTDRSVISFDMVNSMEFVADRFVKISYEHQFKGYILNKIPLLKRLQLREIWGVKMFYGQLSDVNNPYKSSQVVHFDKNEEGETLTYTMGKHPYWEGYVGLDNVLKFFRVQYIYRYNYLHHPNVGRERFRIRFDLDF